MSAFKCSKCGNLPDVDDIFCSKCAKPLNIICPECGIEAWRYLFDNFCPCCGLDMHLAKANKLIWEEK